jgi:hypothetical protein
LFEFKTTLEDFHNSPLWGLHINVPEDIVEQLIDKKSRRVLCTINKQFEFHAAIMPNKGYWFILLNQQNTKKWHLQLGDTIHVKLQKDTSQYGIPMPDELQVALDQEDGAFAYFQALTPGKKRNLIYIVSQVKNTDSRIKKALAIAFHLVESKGVLDFKRLNELIKHYNNNTAF